MVLSVPLLRLQCGTNSYDWGKPGKTSAAARFAAATASDFKIQDDQPYAELWMGTHPSNPSKDVSTGRTLAELIQDNNALMTTGVHARYGEKLPFLFKVLSIQKALSIQAHPDKKLAERLHAEDPRNYPDDNHKPEMTIAITPFDGFCGFRPLLEIASFLRSVSPLSSLVGSDAAESFLSIVSDKEAATDDSTISKNKAALRDLFAALMTAPAEKITALTPELVGDAKGKPAEFAGGKPHGGKELAELISRLDAQFPGDIGLFCAFFLNYVKLQPGEAMFLQANDPHAYLSGDIIECMAASDNVVRAGFTPKFKDVKNLINMLTYSYAPISEQKMSPVPFPKGSNSSSPSPTSILYDPPIDEFAVAKTELKDGAAETFEPIDGPSILIVTHGKGSVKVGPTEMELQTGWVYFVGATAKVQIKAQAEGVTAFRAFCEFK